MTTTTGKQSLPASHGRNRVRRQPRDVAFDVVLYLICTILLILILYPLWFIVIASFSDPSAVAGGHVWFVPVGFTLDGYEELLNQPNVGTPFSTPSRARFSAWPSISRRPTPCLGRISGAGRR